MLYASVFAAVVPLFTLAKGASLNVEYSGATFFDNWTFQNSGDTTTGGQVEYVSQSAALADQLAYMTSENTARVAVDCTTTLAAGANRNSVRMTSTQTFNEGTLLIADLNHMPYGCSVWPALWMLGPNWPTTGEIDIIEGVNANTQNQMTLHTDAGCTHDASGDESGTPLDTSCDSGTGTTNDGCGVIDPSTTSYGAGFAAAGGGVIAMQWAVQGITIWRWTRANIPTDVTDGEPDSTQWGTPVATWTAAGCDPGTDHFQDMQIVIDITLCGDWAGSAAVWDASSCSAANAVCADAVQNPDNYWNAYFDFNSIKVYYV